MPNFKFLIKNQNNQEDKKIIVEFELIVDAAQIFEVPFNYNIEGMDAVEAYEKLINDFPDQNTSILEEPTVGIDEILDVNLSYFTDFIEYSKDEYGRNVRRILDV
jgi:hypothetical protein